jgi:hypothetical protein
LVSDIREEYGLRVFENRVLRRISGPNRDVCISIFIPYSFIVYSHVDFPGLYTLMFGVGLLKAVGYF